MLKLAVEVALGPKVPVPVIPVLLSPPKARVNEPAVLPVTV